jgi:Transposase DDE domain
MASAKKRKKLRRKARKLGDCLRQFLTPAAWRQAQNASLRPWRGSRWRLQPLVMTFLLMTFVCGDSQEERFESARAVVVALRPRRRRPGTTVQGFEKALIRLPMCVLRCLAAAVRGRLPGVLRRWVTHGFVVLGCDGSRLECPRTPVLEKRLGEAGKPDSAPSLWVTALVHLATGVPWAWRLGTGTASERDHLKHLVGGLPERALVVCDAGYTGYELCRALLEKGVAFLIRMSSTVTLYTEERQAVETYREGMVYYWTGKAQQQGAPPLRLRLIRVVGKKKTQRGMETYDVWLLTSVLSARELPAARAGQWYRWRWENEGFFRTYKRTLSMVKLRSRTVALVHREAEVSLLATQLLLAMTASALPAAANESNKVSPRRAVREFRREFQRLIRPRRQRPLGHRLAQAVRDPRPGRSSPKAAREWPRRKPHKPPGAPHFLTMENLQVPRNHAVNAAA